MDDTQPFNYLFASSGDAVEGYFVSCQSRLANVERRLNDLLDQWLSLRRDERIGRSVLSLRRVWPNAPALTASVAAFEVLAPSSSSPSFPEHSHPEILPSSTSQPCAVETLALRRPPQLTVELFERQDGANQQPANDHAPRILFHVFPTRESSSSMPMSEPGSSNDLPAFCPMNSMVTMFNSDPQSPAYPASSFPHALRQSIDKMRAVAVVRCRRAEAFTRPLRGKKQLLRATELAPCAKIA